MSTNKQALREAAEKAIGAHERLSIMPSDDIFDISLAEGTQLDADVTAMNAFNDAAKPATVLALLDELEAAEKRIAELEARPAKPINFKENADADFCRKWAWDEVKKELAPEEWTVGDNFNYYGFFCWGWDSRRQYDEQRAAGITVKGDSE